MNTDNARYEIGKSIVSDGGLRVEWVDGHQSRFHAIWLRHQCTCTFCGTPHNAVRGIRLHHISHDISIASAEVSGHSVKIAWSDDGHRSVYDARWLRDHCYSKQERQVRKHRPVLWDSSIGADPPVVSFKLASADPHARLAALNAVRDYGFCKIVDAPTEAGDASKLIELVGPQRQTHYGTYVLSGKKAVDNVGDTTAALDPHSDETYRLSTIGITVFQVLQPSATGGESTLVDGFEAVRRLREGWPEDFDLLTRVPITAHRIDTAHNSDGQERWYTSRMPVIKLDCDGDVSGVRLNERQIAPLEIDEDLVEPCYSALRRVLDILYDPDLRITFSLGRGEGLLFDNQRLLHGRTAFTQGSPARSVLTSSVNLEDFHSSLRLLQRQVGVDTISTVLCQGISV